MKYFLGIDQGGSKTEAVLCDDSGHILAFEDDRGHRNPGESYAKMQGYWLRCAAEKAVKSAGINFGNLSAVCCALNGADWEEDYLRLQTMVATELSLSPEKILIVNDCIGAMRGGTSDRNCAVLCLGTGMNAAVRAADGREYIYGFYANAPDQGGGALGTKTWQSILDAHNGLCEETLLTSLALEHYQQPDLTSLYKKFTGNQIVFRNYDFSPLLMKAGKMGDAVALRILTTSAERLVHYIESAAYKLGLAGTTVTLVLTGGAFKGDGDLLFSMIEQIVQRKQLNIRCVGAEYEPAAGAALLLLDTLEKEKRLTAYTTFEKEAPGFGLLRLTQE